MNENKAFVTLLSTKDYLEAVLVLKRSLRAVGSKYPLVCGVCEDLLEDQNLKNILRQEGIIIEPIKRLTYSIETRTSWANRPVLNTASKISLFGLTHYDKLCYIDADTFLLQNIDDTLDRLDGTMIKEVLEDDDYGFTGLFVFIPGYHRMDFYQFLLENRKCADGDLLGSLWFFTRTSKEHQLNIDYCRPYHQYKGNRSLDFSKIKVIHFLNEDKPWLHPNKFPEKNIVLDKYYEYLNQLRTDYDFSLYNKTLKRGV